ncbi:MAG: outer membrane beta-barrel protein [Prevotella sp.]|nr:outer membrane beta-barrel protein [Prevotella sp.]
MKKSLLFAVLFSFTINTTVQAQLRDEPYDLWDLLIGGKVGASASTLTKIGGDIKFWPTGSIYTEVFVNPHFSMTFEAGYSRKGANNVIVDEWRFGNLPEDDRQLYEEQVPHGPAHPYTHNFDYMTTSYLMKYYIKQDVDVPVQLAFYSGLSFSTLVSAKSKVGDISHDIKKHLHGGDFSVPLGVELLFGRNFTIDGRWNWSPRKIANNDSELGKVLFGPARNQYFSLTLGYKFLVF